MICGQCNGSGKVEEYYGGNWMICADCQGHGEIEPAGEPGFNCQVHFRVNHQPGTGTATSHLTKIELEATGGIKEEPNTVVNVLLCLAEDIMNEFRKYHALALMGIVPSKSE